MKPNKKHFNVEVSLNLHTPKTVLMDKDSKKQTTKNYTLKLTKFEALNNRILNPISVPDKNCFSYLGKKKKKPSK